MPPIDIHVLVSTLAGLVAGLGSSFFSRPTFIGRLLIGVAFGLGLGLALPGFREAFFGLVLVAASAGIGGSPPRLRGAVVAVGGVFVALMAVRTASSPAVAVPGIAVFVPLALMAPRSTGSNLPMLVSASTFVSLFGVYSAVPDTEAAIGVGFVALGLSLVAWRRAVDMPLVVAIAVVIVAILAGSARQTDIALLAMPALGLMAALVIPRWGRRLETSLAGAPRRQALAFFLHGVVCGLPRLLIIGHL